jgi:hypothetical protein
VINPNTINGKYINFVFGSREFKHFFHSYIDQHFVQDYQRKREHKIKKIIQYVYSTVNPQAAQLGKDTRERIEKNAKFKLPWANFELTKCIESTKAFIERVSKKANRDHASAESTADSPGNDSVAQASPGPSGALEEKALDCLDQKRQGYIDLKETKAMLETFGFGKPSLLYSVLADCERDKKAKEVRHDTFLLSLRQRQLSSSQQRGRPGSRRPRERDPDDQGAAAPAAGRDPAQVQSAIDRQGLAAPLDSSLGPQRSQVKNIDLVLIILGNWCFFRSESSGCESSRLAN